MNHPTRILIWGVTTWTQHVRVRSGERAVSRSITRLTLDNLDDLPERCRECVFWELDPVRAERARARGLAREEKEAWVSHMLLEWGSCGRVAYVDGTPAGFALYAPASFVPGAVSLPTAPAGDDAVLLTTLWVDEDFTGGGLGRVLVQAVVKDLVERGGIRALEAFGTSAASGAAGEPHACVLPTDFLLRVGFKTQRPHPRHPRMRMDLSSVLTWREGVEQAIERVLRAVRPPQPSPGRPGTARGPALGREAGPRVGRD